MPTHPSPSPSRAPQSRPPHLVIIIITCLLLQLPILGASCLGMGAKRLPATQRPYKINNRLYSPLPSAIGYEEIGIASWYGDKFHGRQTSNGETYNMHDITAAHKLLPMHTMLLVTNLENGLKTVVRINDRGPFVQGRIIDLSYGAAQEIALIKSGTARVKITALGELRRDKRSGVQQFASYPNLRSGEYYVQIGAFTNKANGKKLQNRFLETGHRTVIRKATIRNQVFYRVQVYVGSTLLAARKSEKALLEKGYQGAFVLAR